VVARRRIDNAWRQSLAAVKPGRYQSKNAFGVMIYHSVRSQANGGAACDRDSLQIGHAVTPCRRGGVTE
jgi:hypothetical protein